MGTVVLMLTNYAFRGILGFGDWDIRILGKR